MGKVGTGFSLIFQLFILLPFQVFRDVLTFVVTSLVPFLTTIIGSFPLNIIVLISFALIFVMYIFSEPFVIVLMLSWELQRIWINLHIIAMNLIVNFSYNWGAQIWNDTIDFVVLVLEMIWNGLCGGSEGFAEVVDCTGFDNFLIMFEMIVEFLYQSFIINMFVLQLLFAALSDALCADVECSNICETPSCNSWTDKPRIDFITGQVIHNPGLFGLNFKEYLSETDVYYAQIISKIAISFIQFIMEDVVPFIIQIAAFYMDWFKCTLLYFAWVAAWVIGAVARIFAKLAYIVIRAFKSVYNSATATIEFDPGYYSNSSSGYADKHQQEVTDIFVNTYMADFSELFLMRPDLPGNVDFTNFLIDVILLYKGILNIIFEVPLIILQLADKIACIVVNLPFCIPLNDLLCALVRPATKCFVWTIINNGLGNGADGDEYYAEGLYVKDLYSAINNGFTSGASSCKSLTTGLVYENQFAAATKYWNINEVSHGRRRWLNLTCVYLPVYPRNERWEQGVTVCGWLFTPPTCSYNWQCPPMCTCMVGGGSPYGRCFCGGECIHPITGVTEPCRFCRASQIDLRQWGDEGDNWDYSGVWPNGGICGHVFNMETGGPLFIERDSVVGDIMDLFAESFDWAIDFINGLPGPNIPNFFDNFWGRMFYISKSFWDVCVTLFPPSNCPCTTCEVASSQILWYFDLIPGMKGFPCNPAHPDPAKRCCAANSALWFWDDFYEVLGVDLFDENDIVLP